jgi:hypothetical protein
LLGDGGKVIRVQEIVLMASKGMNLYFRPFRRALGKQPRISFDHEICAGMNTIELEKLLTRFYTRYNPEKLPTINALAVQFVGKEDNLNRLLKERYEADLNDILLAPQGNPEVPPHQETDAMVPAGLDEGSSHNEADDTSKWEATMSSMDSTISKAEISSGANLSAIVKATSKALKAALQENQELKVLNQDLCAQLEQRYSQFSRFWTKFNLS